MHQINLDAVDTDGAVREAAEEVASDTRLDFLRKATVAGGSVVGGGAILGALAPAAMAAGTRPPSSFGKGDIGILNYALTLEYLESTFYTEAKQNLLSKLDAQGQQFLKTVQADEATHVSALRSTLGSKAVKKPKFNFGKAVTDPATFLATSYVLENTGVHAYLGQAPNIKAAKVLLTAASIVTVEARHSGAIAVILGKKINANGAFDNGYSASKVLAAVKKTGFIV